MMMRCPCGSQRVYIQCCGLYLTERQCAPSPEALMRSRYTAYTVANMAYIRHTMQGQALLHFNEEQAKKWTKCLVWLGLKVLKTINESTHHGFVEFIATYLEDGKIQSIHEISEFVRDQDRWYYVDGKHLPVSQALRNQKVGRNQICPCGSQKKFKHCHGTR